MPWSATLRVVHSQLSGYGSVAWASGHSLVKRPEPEFCVQIAKGLAIVVTSAIAPGRVHPVTTGPHCHDALLL